MALYIGSNKKRTTLGSLSVLFATYEVVTGIAVTTPPTKTEYSAGAVFDPTGMVVTATYSNGATKEITNYTILNGDQLSADMTTVIISYTERGTTVTAEYEIEVAPSTVTVTLNLIGSALSMFSNGVGTMTINGVATAPNTETSTYLVNIGDTIVFATRNDITAPIVVTINGEMVQSNEAMLKTYTYSVKSNVTIDALASGNLMLYFNEQGAITPEPAMCTLSLPNGWNIEGEGDNYAEIDAGIDLEGVSSVEVPVGTILDCYIEGDDDYHDSAAQIIVNGESVQSEKLRSGESLEHQFTVTKNTTVALSVTDGENCVITITEQTGADEPTLISFSINESGNTTTYQAEEGMTWGEWVDSEYNDDGSSGGVKPYIVENDMIYHTEQSLSVMVSNVYTFPSPNDLIITNGVYELAKD